MEPIEALKRRIEEYKSSLSDYLIGGGCRTMEEYSRATGKYEALELVLTDMSEIEKRYIES